MYCMEILIDVFYVFFKKNRGIPPLNIYAKSINMHVSTCFEF